MSDDVQLETEIELVSLAELQPYANNPKQHPDHQVDKIATSIKETGWDVPIVVGADGEIVKGHGRYAAAQQLELDEVPVIWRDGMSPDDVKSARIADNKTQMESGFDYDALGAELDALDSDFGIDTDSIAEQTGFDEMAVSDLTANDPPDTDELFGDDDADEDDTDANDSTADDDDSDDDVETEPETPDSMTYTCPDCGHSFEAE
jgi:ParB-like chromosome segregation protein Spo0J